MAYVVIFLFGVLFGTGMTTILATNYFESLIMKHGCARWHPTISGRLQWKTPNGWEGE